MPDDKPRVRRHPPPTAPPMRLLRKETVQRMLSVSAWTLRRMVRDHEIASVKLSPREVRFREQDVMDWIEAKYEPAVKSTEPSKETDS